MMTTLIKHAGFPNGNGETACEIAVESNDIMYSNFNAEEIWPGIDYIKTVDFKELKSSYAEKIIVDAHSTEDMNTLMKYITDDSYKNLLSVQSVSVLR